MDVGGTMNYKAFYDIEYCIFFILVFSKFRQPWSSELQHECSIALNDSDVLILVGVDISLCRLRCRLQIRGDISSVEM